MEKSSTAIINPTLTHSNYSKWALVMQVNLQAAAMGCHRAWHRWLPRGSQCAGGTATHRIRRDAGGLARKESTADAWEAIQAIQMGGDRIKEATTDKLHRDFGGPAVQAEECVEDFSLHISAIAISIETLVDINSMSIEEATGHLRVVEERKKKATDGAKEERLLLTEEEWMARLKAHRGDLSNSSRGGRCHGSDSGRGSQSDSHKEGMHRSKANDTCRACGKLGH
jgi:hypothetical protein